MTIHHRSADLVTSSIDSLFLVTLLICTHFETIITTQFMPWFGKKVSGNHISKATNLSALVFEICSIMPKVMYQILWLNTSYLLVSWLAWLDIVSLTTITSWELLTRYCREWAQMWRCLDSILMKPLRQLECLVSGFMSRFAQDSQPDLQTYHAFFDLCVWRDVCCLLIVSEAHIQFSLSLMLSRSLWTVLQGKTWTCMQKIRNQSTADCLTEVMRRSRNLLNILGNRRNTGKTLGARLGIMREPEHKSRLETRTAIGVRMEIAAVPLSTRMIMKTSHTRIGRSRRPLHLHTEKGDLRECPAAPYIEQVYTRT